MRLDGSVAPEKRFEIVKAFNSDPTIDVLLLTTHGMLFQVPLSTEVLLLSCVVKFSERILFKFTERILFFLPLVGGLGLNLTSADTLVFMEHDWNPMRDHQVDWFLNFLWICACYIEKTYFI